MRRTLCSLVLVVLVASGCGSRTSSGDDPDPDGGLDDTATEETAATEGAVTPDSPTIGTVANPCSGDPTEGEVEPGTPGVTDDAIRIGVISDRQNPTVPLPTAGIEESVRAFVEFCNQAGGIDGRRLELVAYDSEIVATDDVTKQACADDLFALVGTGSVQDQLGVESRESCGLVEVGAYSATPERRDSVDFFQPVPSEPDHELSVGPCGWIASQHPAAVTRAAMVYIDLPASARRAEKWVEACEAEAGFDFLVDHPLSFGETNLGPLVQQIRDADIGYLTMVSSTAETLTLLRELAVQDVEIEVVDLGAQYYEEDFAADPATDGVLVTTANLPFVDAPSSPAMTLYIDRLAATDAPLTTLGVQAFSAGMLFATAVDGLDGALSRAALVDALSDIHEWDGGGLHSTTDPGAGVTNPCFAYVRVEGADFVRAHPAEGFSCDPATVVEVSVPG